MKKLEHVLSVRSSHITPKPGYSEMPEYLSMKDTLPPEAMMFGSRDWLETDEDFLQIIPYCVITSENGDVLAYSRTAQTGENRLAGKISVGLGGHVNAEGLLQRNGIINSPVTIMNSCYRELDEEVTLPLDDDYPFLIDFKGFIYDPSDEVGRVHLGLLMQCKISDELEPVKHKISSSDKGINILGFYSKEYLLTSDEVELEGWSRIALEAL